MKKQQRFFCLLFTLIVMGEISGQDTIGMDAYNRAVSFQYANYYDKKAFNLYVRPNWFPDSSGLWFVEHGPKLKKYRKVVFPEMLLSDLFDHGSLATVLSDSLDSKIDPNDLPIGNIEYLNADQLKISIKQKTYTLNTKTRELRLSVSQKPRKEMEELSPNEEWVAFTSNYNLYIKSTAGDDVRQLSQKGEKNYEYASWYGWGDIMKGENGERPERFGVSWSEDSEWISTNICDLRSARKMYLLDWSIDTLFRPELLSYYRGSPGDTSMVYMEPVFFNVSSGVEVKPDLPRSTHINSIGVRWSDRPATVYLQHMERGYQNVRLYSFDLAKEKMDLVYSESSSTNIDNFRYHLAEESNSIFVLSEKEGWRQIYRVDTDRGEQHAVTKGDYYVHQIERIDEPARRIYFLASGREEGRNPYYQHLYSIDFDGDNLKLLTPENCHHRISISPDGDYFFDNFSTVNVPTKTVVRSAASGEILAQVTKAFVDDLPNWTPPEIFTTTARDSKTTLYGALWKPTNFDSTLIYPVIESSYTGPHTQVFPKDFSRAFGLQSYAELGFIVVVVDGLGSSGRSKEFHDYSYKNLGGNLEDHIIAIKHLGRKYGWIDTTRVGIFGHSAGGYDAGHALLAYPDFYKVGVASSADHDHRMEKAWWPEMYMGWPVDSAYHLQSNITMAGNLKGKLLISHGGIDENVNPSATFKLAEALIKADKQFDMLILPSQRHGYHGKHQKYFTKSRWNYFIKHLRGVEPRWDFGWVPK